MKNGKIIFSTYLATLLLIVYINNFIESVALYNISIAFIFMLWGFREAWLWEKTFAPEAFKNITKIGAILVFLYFISVTMQEAFIYLGAREYVENIDFYYIAISTLIILGYIYKKMK